MFKFDDEVGSLVINALINCDLNNKYETRKCFVI